jgi:hypothetical protein
MIRPVPFVLVTVLATMSLSAQAPDWRVRIDQSRNAQDPDDTPNLKFVPSGRGFHATGGPAGTFWIPSTTAAGSYTVQATFTLVRPSNHTNYYGLVFGGSDLDGAAQSYVYFMVAQDGTYLIRQRTGEMVSDVHPRRPHDAVRRPDGSGRSVNALEVRVAGDTVSYVVNGTVVQSGPKGGLRTDGLVGVRINHLLDVQVDGFQVRRPG